MQRRIDADRDDCPAVVVAAAMIDDVLAKLDAVLPWTPAERQAVRARAFDDVRLRLLTWDATVH